MSQLDICLGLDTMKAGPFSAMRLACNRRPATDSLYPMFGEVVEAFLLSGLNRFSLRKNYGELAFASLSRLP